MKTVSIIIPVYNEEKRIIPTIQSVLKAKTMSLKKEIIIVDDGSDDGTVKIIKKTLSELRIASGDSISLLEKKENEGKGAALKKGFAAATGDIFLVQDADMEYSVDDYPDLLKPLLEGHALVVYGSRNRGERKYHNHYSYFSFYWGGKVLTAFINLLFGLDLTDQPTGYKVFHKSKRSLLIKPKENDFSYEVAITSLLGRSNAIISEVPIHYYPRSIKEGKKINAMDFVKGVLVGVKYRFANP